MVIRDKFLTIENIEQEDINLDKEVKRFNLWSFITFNSIFFGLWTILFIIALLEG